MAELRAFIRRLPRTRRDAIVAVLSLAAAACLAIDAYVHLTDAGDYAAVRTSVVSQAALFRIEGAVAIVAAIGLLVRPRPRTWALAAFVLATGVGAVVVYTYVDIGQVGPLPNMYEPSWVLPGKVASAWAEGIGAAIALAGLAVSSARKRGLQPSAALRQRLRRGVPSYPFGDRGDRHSG